MTTLLLAFFVMGLIMVGMAVGVLCGRKPIAGSCGGMSAIGMISDCDICGGNKDICETEQEKNAEKASARTDLAYDAMQNEEKNK